jgi:hypothetical protein
MKLQIRVYNFLLSPLFSCPRSKHDHQHRDLSYLQSRINTNNFSLPKFTIKFAGDAVVLIPTDGSSHVK